MNILHIVSSLDPKGGGPTRSITGLSRGLAGTGVDATLFVHSNEHVMPDTSGVKFHTGSGQISKILSDVKHEIEGVLQKKTGADWDKSDCLLFHAKTQDAT